MPQNTARALVWLSCLAATANLAVGQTKEVILHNFGSTLTDGAYPSAGVIRDSAGNLYGTTVGGGKSNKGAVYKIDTSRHATTLYSFTGGADGSGPMAGVVRDPAGNLYGTTVTGGSGRGVVYELDTSGTETVLHSFTGGADGAEPMASLAIDSAGNLYGTAFDGADGACGAAGGCGVVFELNSSGSNTVLYSFLGGTDGANPEAQPTLDSAGNLYGTTSSGGAFGGGTVYELDTSGQETVLYSLCSEAKCADGREPLSGVVRDSAGNLYGTAAYGGTGSCTLQCGVLYKLDAAGNYTVLHAFTGGSDGGTPYGGVTIDKTGNLYGTTYLGGTGTCNCGVVYTVDATGTFTVLHTFTTGTDGRNPYAAVIRDKKGNLYGTTRYGGRGGLGVVFKLEP